MKSSFLHFTKISLLVLFVFHVGMHILYLAPINPATNDYSHQVHLYMDTLFSQNWHLFAPEPATSGLQLQYRCTDHALWVNPLKDLAESHKALPITAEGKQMYVYQNLARQIYNAKILNTLESEVPEVKLLQKFLAVKCPMSQAEVRVERIFTQDYSQRNNKTKGKVDSYHMVFNQGSLYTSASPL
jgi:hypothetical protein